MFDLAYPLEDTIEIDDITYQVDMSFDNILRLYDMLNDKELDDVTQILVGIEMLLGVCFLCDFQTQYEIFEKVFKGFISKGAEENLPVDIEGNPMPITEKDKNPFSIKEDAEYIYASFYQDYGIDLFEQQGKLHWEKFKALLGGLRKDTKFKEVVEIRTMELPTGKGTQKQRENIKKLQEHYKLKGTEPI